MEAKNIEAGLAIMRQCHEKGLPLNWSQAKHIALVVKRILADVEAELGEIEPEGRKSLTATLRKTLGEDTLATNQSSFRQAFARAIKDRPELAEFYKALAAGDKVVEDIEV